MEQHPVPRNISGFQFHLIGDMTLRQFLYLAGGVLLAFIIYKLAPFPTFIRITFAAVSGLTGFAFAFLPIQERPLDRWVVSFIKSVFAPTQYLWQKEGIELDLFTTKAAGIPVTFSPIHAAANLDAKVKLQNYLKSLPVAPHQNLNTAEKRYIDNTLALFDKTNVSPVVPPSVWTTPTLTTLSESIPTSPSTPITKPVVKLTPDMPKPVVSEKEKTPAPPPPLPVETLPLAQKPENLPKPVIKESVDLQSQLTKLDAEKQALAEELRKLKEELKTMEAPSVIRPSPPTETKKSTIKTFTPAQAVNEVGMPTLPQTPNLVIGVIKDAQKRFIPNLIITIKDSKNVPLRALKTNKLGQFTVATPLSNGTYFLEVEDPLKRYAFDIAEISLSGRVFLPIEIIAKGEKELVREKLTKELFGSANM